LLALLGVHHFLHFSRIRVNTVSLHVKKFETTQIPKTKKKKLPLQPSTSNGEIVHPN
jgi:hypothetical protein